MNLSQAVTKAKSIADLNDIFVSKVNVQLGWAIYSKNRFQIHEHRGSSHWVEWIPIEHFEQGKAVLFPSMLTNKIAAI